MLTDGAVTNVREIVDLAASHKDLAEVHTIGIGSGASPSLVIELAEVTGGSFNFALENENIKPKVVSALAKASRPNLINARVRLKLHINMI